LSSLPTECVDCTYDEVWDMVNEAGLHWVTSAAQIFIAEELSQTDTMQADVVNAYLAEADEKLLDEKAFWHFANLGWEGLNQDDVIAILGDMDTDGDFSVTEQEFTDWVVENSDFDVGAYFIVKDYKYFEAQREAFEIQPFSEIDGNNLAKTLWYVIKYETYHPHLFGGYQDEYAAMREAWTEMDADRDGRATRDEIVNYTTEDFYEANFSEHVAKM